eukprot:scaffold50_cov420-Prasinococcus_capsulatus_cf.AAC.11
MHGGPPHPCRSLVVPASTTGRQEQRVSTQRSGSLCLAKVPGTSLARCLPQPSLAARNNAVYLGATCLHQLWGHGTCCRHLYAAAGARRSRARL